MSSVEVVPSHVPRPIAQQLRLLGWVHRAWRRLGWRQLALAAFVFMMTGVVGPSGGILFRPGGIPADPFYDLLAGRWLFQVLPLVFVVMIADEAYRDGVGVVAAYLGALLLGSLAAGVLDVVGQHVVGFSSDFRRFQMEQRLFQGGLCIATYAYWRTTQRALQQLGVAEAERVRHRQDILSARLLALQARVDPQFLFDALSHVGKLHERDADAADALLTELIALLRAMLPSGTSATSSVEREFALARSWLRVQQHLGRRLEVEIATSPLVASSSLGPMLVLPMLQEIDDPRGRSVTWCLSAEPIAAAAGADVRAPRLRLRLSPKAEDPQRPRIGAADNAAIERLRDRLVQLYGAEATLTVLALEGDLRTFILDLPLAQETVADVHRPDR